jgi:fructose-bisphosphate aldolase class II
MSHIEEARRLFRRTRQEGFAVGAFNVDNQETLKAIAQAAARKRSPALVEVSHSEVEAIGLANMRSLVDNYRRELGVELYVNLDHSPSVEAARAGIDAGFELIHIDISQAHHAAPDEEIVEATREVVEYARRTGALVESEPHYFGGSSTVHAGTIDYEQIRRTFSTPEGARKFVRATGIDTFAAAVGNLHGLYDVPKQLDLDLLRRIRGTIDCFISLHGGSGTPDRDFVEAARIGVSKININTELRRAYRTTLEAQLRQNPEEYAIVKLIAPVIAAVQAIVESKMDVFGSTGKANSARTRS